MSTDDDHGEHGDDDHGEHGDDDHGEHGDDDHGERGGRGHGDDRACSVEELTPGAVVSEAELRATADGLVYEEIELVHRNPDRS